MKLHPKTAAYMAVHRTPATVHPPATINAATFSLVTSSESPSTAANDRSQRNLSSIASTIGAGRLGFLTNFLGGVRIRMRRGLRNLGEGP